MIELSDKDADSILCYLRHNLEEENERYRKYCKASEELRKSESSSARILMQLADYEHWPERLEEEHRQTVDKLVSFIEIMTAGSK